MDRGLDQGGYEGPPPGSCRPLTDGPDPASLGTSSARRPPPGYAWEHSASVEERSGPDVGRLARLGLEKGGFRWRPFR
jgi:hypothetical protein